MNPNTKLNHQHPPVPELDGEPQHLRKPTRLRKAACSSPTWVMRAAQMWPTVLVLLVAVVLAVGTRPAEGADIFTSLAELPKVLHAEYSLAEALRNYVQAEQRRLNRLKE